MQSMAGSDPGSLFSRREFLARAACFGVAVSSLPLAAALRAADPERSAGAALTFPGPWQFLRPKSAIILVSDQQLEDLQDPDKEVDLSLSGSPNLTTLRKVCEGAKAQGARTLILAFDEFWSQYRKGQGGKPRQLLPDTDEYIQRLAKLSQTVKTYGLGFELSLLSPLELGRGYQRKTGEKGRWVQYREGYRDPATGQYTVSLWEQHRWTNNKGAVELERQGIRVFAFRERRVRGSQFYAVDPASIVELKTAPELDPAPTGQPSTGAGRLTVRGRGDAEAGDRDRVLVVVSYATPEMDYFSPKAPPFLRDLVDRYHAAGVPLNGLYADEMHIQQDWGYASHHDVGQFTFRYLTPALAQRFAQLYGARFADFEKYLVYFCYAQHEFLPSLDARLAAQHTMGDSPDDIAETSLLRRRYYDLLENTVVDLFAEAKRYAEERYGQALEARAHATWAQSPTIDFWENNSQAMAPRQYEYTPEFVWSNTVHQAAAACSDYFAWNKFLTGGGNDHAEGGWLDRNYYGIALACSTGILNRTPYAYAAAWGMPGEIGARHQAVCDAFGASASPWFQAVEDAQHRDEDVLMLYPMSLVAAEERFGSWMVQYAYANYVTPRKLLEHGRVTPEGKLELAGRLFGTLVVLFEPLPPEGLLPLVEDFLGKGGRVIWSGPPPRVDFTGTGILSRWQEIFGVKRLTSPAGRFGGGWTVRFSGALDKVPPQAILTDFLVDLAYPVEASSGAAVVARLGRNPVGVHRSTASGGSATYLGFRPRDDQAASLGEEVRTWFEILFALGAYPKRAASAVEDHPTVVSRNSPYAACRFPNGTTSLAAHYRSIEESWPGGFHRDAQQDAQILAQLALAPARLELRDFAVNGHRVAYEGDLAVAFRLDDRSALIAFAGHRCQRIAIDGRAHAIASAPMEVVAWAPVAPARRVPGGAVLELWAHGEADLEIPLPAGIEGGELFFQGATIDSLGARIACACSDGLLRFHASNAWPQKHLFFVAS